MDLKLRDTQLLIAESKAQSLLRNQLAYLLATAFWETARTMQPVDEAFWLSEAWRKKNLRYGRGAGHQDRRPDAGTAEWADRPGAVTHPASGG